MEIYYWGADQVQMRHSWLNQNFSKNFEEMYKKFHKNLQFLQKHALINPDFKKIWEIFINF